QTEAAERPPELSAGVARQTDKPTAVAGLSGSTIRTPEFAPALWVRGRSSRSRSVRRAVASLDFGCGAIVGAFGDLGSFFLFSILICLAASTFSLSASHRPAYSFLRQILVLPIATGATF